MSTIVEGNTVRSRGRVAVVLRAVSNVEPDSNSELKYLSISAGRR